MWPVLIEIILKRHENLPEYVLHFCRFLRGHQFTAGPAEEMELLSVFAQYMPVSAEEFKSIFKSLLVKNYRQFRSFEKLYKEFWSEILTAENARIRKEKIDNSASSLPSKTMPPSLLELKNWLYSGKNADPIEAYTYSSFESLTKKDFSKFSKTEIKSLQEIIRWLALKFKLGKSRRFTTTSKKKQIDYKQTIRLAMRRNLEIDRFRFRMNKRKKLRLVVLCDVSRSMDLYSQFLIRFLYGMNQSNIRIESFVFSTSLTHISPLIRYRDLDQVLTSLSEFVHHWSGGTRIGQCFSDFKYRFGRQYLKDDTWLFILSDGIDTGNIEELTRAMKFFKKRTAKIIWLNPLAGQAGYKPSVRGMEAALPFVDVFAPAYSIDSFKQALSDIIAAR